MKNLDKQKPNYLVTEISTSSKKISSLVHDWWYLLLLLVLLFI
jgi:hypothetical protein